ncbi:MAG: bifunctional riboflavin kinase/FAD synthetase [Clostridia bacterium]|nr:bifunctional riboflavin kinase/FAD synthetase [Clostridia bacterium]
MRIISFKKTLPLSFSCGTGLCLGHFDGVHVGHKALFEELKRRNAARAQKLPLGVLCFTTPPTATLNKQPTPQLTTLEEKLALIAAAGLDFAVLYDFPSIKDMPPEQFVSEILVGECNAKMLVCGFNYSFGAHGAGTPTDLERLFCTQDDRALSVMPPVTDGPLTVSSSLVRALLLGGHPDDAARLMARPYTLTGTVTDGRRLGRTMGLPTANLTFPDGALVPLHGVYAVTVKIGTRTYQGISNVGTRPTVNHGRDVNCETFIFDFKGELYGREIKICFLHFLREEQKFEGLDELEAQIRCDIERAKQYLS